MPFWVYMLHCRGGALYTGHTDNLELRLHQHQQKQLKGFKHDKLPVKLVRSDSFATRIEAFESERRIKGWSRAKKLALIRGDWKEISVLARSKDGPSTSSGRTDVRGTSVKLSSGRTDIRRTGAS
ncbi:MAG: GIY-YIG nuclease family protein [Sphingomicrobium sp.]